MSSIFFFVLVIIVSLLLLLFYYCLHGSFCDRLGFLIIVLAVFFTCVVANHNNSQFIH